MASSNPTTWYAPILSSTSQAAAYLRIPLIASTGIAVFLSGLLYFKQSELIYPRNIPLDSRTSIFKPSDFQMSNFEDLSLPSPDGESLHAYLIRPSNVRLKRDVSVLMFHGNAGNIGHRLPIARVLAEDLGFTVLMIEYRGYGRSTGKPSERGFIVDAQTGLDYLKERVETSAMKVLVYGQSIGSAVAIQLVAKNQQAVQGLVIENTFTSMRKLIPQVMPPAKYVTRLCHQTWDSETILPSITGVPLLFLSGLKDEICPASHMAQLFAVAKAKKTVWKEFPEGTHNETCAQPGYFDEIDDFVVEYVEKKDG